MSNEYVIHDIDSIGKYLTNIEEVVSVLGDKSSWKIKEVGDGNLNLVFIVEGSNGGCIVKQALPYVRKAGESWPMDKDRAWYEYKALDIEYKCVGKLVPEIYHFNREQSLIIMEFLTPHIILRKELINGKKFDKLGENISEYLAQTLFKTSDLYLEPKDKRNNISIFNNNVALCRITEDLVFTEPYFNSDRNYWNTPLIDKEVMQLRSDTELKIASQKLKYYFMNNTDCLLHGDLHTGSIMVTPENTRIIDPEFAFYGPMGFDLGAVFANLFLSYFSQKAHRDDDEYKEYTTWLLNIIDEIWTKFEVKFTHLWNTERSGTLYSKEIFEEQGDAEGAYIACKMFLDELQEKTLGFTAAKMIRRIVGFAHVEDIESIRDLEKKAECEKRILKFARNLMVNTDKIKTIQNVLRSLD